MSSRPNDEQQQQQQQQHHSSLFLHNNDATPSSSPSFLLSPPMPPFTSQLDSSCSFPRCLVPPPHRDSTTPPPHPHPPPPPPVPICSVLNTVVDHIMLPPSPLEPRDYQQQQQQNRPSRQAPVAVGVGNDAPEQPGTFTVSSSSSVPVPPLVPVLRIFGPLWRRDRSAVSSSSSRCSTSQSAAVYIHGAFPYLLARPVRAGPDGRGGGGGGSSSLSSSLSLVDWDCVTSVQRILPLVRASLEAAVQASFSAWNDPTSTTTSTTTTSTTVVLRDLTVVVGRGFYTYCAGPPAPFLRIEYYDPSHRWRIKAALERGLDDVPLFYDHTAMNQENDHDENEEEKEEEEEENAAATETTPMDAPLSFHCYEAHIPYTMQFFKDYNLAGLSYIHCSHVQLRHPLPKSIPWRGGGGSLGTESSSPATTTSTSTTTDLAFLEENTSEHYQWPKSSAHVAWWTKRATSADVELDISVEHILNVHDILTDGDEDHDEDDPIHWRAVPSLRDLWMQERRRMASLLPPQDDFLSPARARRAKEETTSPPPPPPPFTLNVKRDAELPGARSACEGMKRLVAVTEGLQDDFDRALQDILNRHQASLQKADAYLRRRQQRQERFYRPQRNKAPTAMASILEQPMDEEHEESEQKDAISSTQLTPSNDEALLALEGLNSLLEESNEKREQSLVARSPKVDDRFQVVEQQLAQSMDSSQQSSSQIDEWTPTAGPRVCQTLSQSTFREDKFQTLSQSYCNHQFRGDGESMNDHSLQQAYEFSQRVERGDGVVDGPIVHVDDFINPETLLPFDPADNYSSDEDASVDKFDLEQTLTNMASQSEYYETGEGLDEPDLDSKKQPAFWPLSQLETVKETGGKDKNDPDSDSAASEERDNQLLDGEEMMPFDGWTNETTDSATEREESKHLSIESDGSFVAWRHESNVLITQTKWAPARSEMFGPSAAGLYPTPQARDQPPWMMFTFNYERLRRTLSSPVDWSNSRPPAGSDVYPVCPAPTRNIVDSWWKRKRKREQPTNKRPRMEDAAGDGNEKRESKISKTCDAGHRKNDNFSSNEWKQEVEHVDWNDPLQPQLGLTQQSGFDLPMSQNKTEKNMKGDDMRTSQESSKRAADTPSATLSRSTPDCTMSNETPSPGRALHGIGNQGGKIHVEGGGQLKATRPSHKVGEHGGKNQQGASEYDDHYFPTPVSVMAIEVHIQCRVGQSVSGSKQIAMTPDSDRDKVYAISYIFARDPGGGESSDIIERGCLFVPLERELQQADSAAAGGFPSLSARLCGAVRSGMPRDSLGQFAPLSVECLRDERSLLLRLASIVRWKDPDMLLSWDTQGAGIGYLVERGCALGKKDNNRVEGPVNAEIDMARLLGRTPSAQAKADNKGMKAFMSNNDGLEVLKLNEPESTEIQSKDRRWRGSGLGSDWDERVGAGAAAASIVSDFAFPCFLVCQR